jgi:hypothetical protein
MHEIESGWFKAGNTPGFCLEDGKMSVLRPTPAWTKVATNQLLCDYFLNA